MYQCLFGLFEIELFMCIKMDLALNNLQRSICHKTQTNKTTNMLYSIKDKFFLDTGIDIGLY